ncbi:hypothetical protein [Legionella worsleiensis]|uniref:hypothetical protein n=1 Tax=Legionella worsleiensis TaxID=45076 RepID=UPI0012ED55DA|nr:hypothetical protein [Legionella worsleiensis]
MNVRANRTLGERARGDEGIFDLVDEGIGIGCSDLGAKKVELLMELGLAGVAL